MIECERKSQTKIQTENYRYCPKKINENFVPIGLNVSLFSKNEHLATFPWVSIDLMVNIEATYPDFQPPNYPIHNVQSYSINRSMSSIGRCFKIGTKKCFLQRTKIIKY